MIERCYKAILVSIEKHEKLYKIEYLLVVNKIKEMSSFEVNEDFLEVGSYW